MIMPGNIAGNATITLTGSNGGPTATYYLTVSVIVICVKGLKN